MTNSWQPRAPQGSLHGLCVCVCVGVKQVIYTESECVYVCVKRAYLHMHVHDCKCM